MNNPNPLNQREGEKKSAEVPSFHPSMENLQSALKDYSLSVSTVPEKGRSLFASRDFYPGDVIIGQEPYVCVPNNSSLSTPKRCDGCFITSDVLRRCSRCHVAYYCGTACQRSEWKLHRLECEVLSRLDKDKRKSVTPSIRLMVRLYLRRKLQDDKVTPSTAMDNYNLVEALVAHMSDITEEQLVLYAQMANLVYSILKWPEINIKEIAENFSKFACNAHTICDNELRPVGTGLYPVISIINHSCLPNSVLVFEGRSALVRAVQHIPAGTEVVISYIETAGSTITRQRALKEQYLFTCTCPRCSKMGQKDDIQESEILEGYRCKNEKCGGFLLRTTDGKGFQCQGCQLVMGKEEIKEIITEIELLSEEAASKSSFSCSYQEVISIYKKIEKLQTKLYHPFSINLMQTREKILKSLMELEHWTEALAYCKLTIPFYEKVYPSVHPLLGLQYYTCGKLEWYLGETKEAVKSLTKAVDILRITHGTNTRFMKDLLMKLEEAHAEASYKWSSIHC
ncbi:histone-lysine N-methyltransferase ASHR1 [Vigna umbellata]|uniref:histone-lysine N-methyltransferase ASHR1 n=1 Tax=Vigna umbellata TaxID=87088 RepID=UPI001F5E984A|nr:histone-lysine N-methyltransferase ASHR1 [Vigna umbellata]